MTLEEMIAHPAFFSMRIEAAAGAPQKKQFSVMVRGADKPKHLGIACTTEDAFGAVRAERAIRALVAAFEKAAGE